MGLAPPLWVAQAQSVHIAMADTGWPGCAKSLKGVILDLCGVLYDSGDGDGVAIPGSIEAVKRLKESDLQLRFCTNETQATREKFVAKLQRLGFDISVAEVFPPAPAAIAVLKERGLRPHLLVHEGLLPEFDAVDKTNPNCVIIGDAAENFSYQNLNEAFRVLIGLERPVLFSLGQGRYYKETDGLKLDVGVYMKALEYACDLKAEVIGKPSPTFFQSVLGDMGLKPNEAKRRETPDCDRRRHGGQPGPGRGRDPRSERARSLRNPPTRRRLEQSSLCVAL
uniref:Phospholysine phosphohistidine inorganic pyrophosphate phosphatase n=1 Tax=Fundulus heteroclitus TaxID=8078 RepID=A0A3Q2UC45_FUNHE